MKRFEGFFRPTPPLDNLSHSSRPNERYSKGVSPVRFLKKEKKYSVDWKPKKKEISFTD